jgi:hypothetical protein
MIILSTKSVFEIGELSDIVKILSTKIILYIETARTVIPLYIYKRSIIIL